MFAFRQESFERWGLKYTGRENPQDLEVGEATFLREKVDGHDFYRLIVRWPSGKKSKDGSEWAAMLVRRSDFMLATAAGNGHEFISNLVDSLVAETRGSDA